MDTYLKFYRSLTSLWWYKDVSLRLVMMHLILTANHADVQMPGVLVKRGSTVTSRSKMRADIGITDKVLRRCLKQLEMAGEVAKMPINRTSKMGTVITVCKYDVYVGSTSYAAQTKVQDQVQERAKIKSKIATNKTESQISKNQGVSTMKEKDQVQERSKIRATNKNIYGRNNILSEDKIYITPLVAGAPAREGGQVEVQISKKEEIELLRKKFFGQEQAGTFEQLCMSMKCTQAEFKEIAEEIFAEWILTEEPVKENYSAVSRHLIATARIKLSERRRAAAREPKQTRTREQWRAEVSDYLNERLNQTYLNKYPNENGIN